MVLVDIEDKPFASTTKEGCAPPPPPELATTLLLSITDASSFASSR